MKPCLSCKERGGYLIVRTGYLRRLENTQAKWNLQIDAVLEKEGQLYGRTWQGLMATGIELENPNEDM